MDDRSDPRLYDYRGALAHSRRVAWDVDDVLPLDTRFDRTCEMLPRELVETPIDVSLGRDERLARNHLRARGYLGLFGLVEEFIVPFVLGHLQTRACADAVEIEALANFAGEELKHIALFRRFLRVFDEGREPPGEIIGPPEEVSVHVLSQPPLAVGLLVLHIEWTTQRHYLAMVRGNGRLEPNFARLLHRHWLEESQHARIDGWMLSSVASRSSHETRREGVEGYLALLDWLDDGLSEQALADTRVLQRLGSSAAIRDPSGVARAQHRALRRTFLSSGLVHPRVREAIVGMGVPVGSALDIRVERWS